MFTMVWSWSPKASSCDFDCACGFPHSLYFLCFCIGRHSRWAFHPGRSAAANLAEVEEVFVMLQPSPSPEKLLACDVRQGKVESVEERKAKLLRLRAEKKLKTVAMEKRRNIWWNCG
jgi:hypothetical protein